MSAIYDFTKSFHINNWVSTPDTGSIDISDTPKFLKLTSSNIFIETEISREYNTSFIITIPSNGTIKFDWLYNPIEEPVYDPFGYLLNGTFFVISNNDGETSSEQRGTFQKAINAGDIFGFNARSTDGRYGASTTFISNFSFTVSPTVPPIVSNICFYCETFICTDQENIPINQIDITKHTINKKHILAVTKTIQLDEFLVCFDKDVLAPNIPSRRTIMSCKHKILFMGRMRTAKSFVGKFDRGVRLVKYKGEFLYNIILDDHTNLVNANNLTTETLHTDNMVSKLVKSCLSLSDTEKAAAYTAFNAAQHRRNANALKPFFFKFYPRK